MNPFELDKNKTTIFLLPILFPHITYNELITNYFEEAYIGILDDEDYDDSLLLKFNHDNLTSDLIEDIKELIDRSEDLVDIIGENTFCYEIPNNELENYEHFLHGRYTKFSDDAKVSILSFWNEGEKSLLYYILNKPAKGTNQRIPVDLLKHYGTEDMLDSLGEIPDEVWPPPSIELDEMLLL